MRNKKINDRAVKNGFSTTNDFFLIWIVHNKLNVKISFSATNEF